MISRFFVGLALLVGSLLQVTPPASSQTRLAVGFIGGATESDDRFGLEPFVGLTGGVEHAFGPLVLSAKLEGDIVRRTDVRDTPYILSDQFNPNGTDTVYCYNRRSRYQISMSYCEGIQVYGTAASVDAAYRIPGASGMAIGAGYRAGLGGTPYAMALYRPRPGAPAGLAFKAQVSPRLINIGADLQFSL